MWQTGAVNWEQTTVMFKVSFQYGSCQTMSLSIIQYNDSFLYVRELISTHMEEGGEKGNQFSCYIHFPSICIFFFCHSQLSCPYDTMALTSTLHVESVHYTHVQEEFVYWLEYFKSRRKHMSLKKMTAPELTKIDQQ